MRLPTASLLRSLDPGEARRAAINLGTDQRRSTSRPAQCRRNETGHAVINSWVPPRTATAVTRGGDPMAQATQHPVRTDVATSPPDRLFLSLIGLTSLAILLQGLWAGL